MIFFSFICNACKCIICTSCFAIISKGYSFAVNFISLAVSDFLKNNNRFCSTVNIVNVNSFSILLICSGYRNSTTNSQRFNPLSIQSDTIGQICAFNCLGCIISIFVPTIKDIATIACRNISAECRNLALVFYKLFVESINSSAHSIKSHIMQIYCDI